VVTELAQGLVGFVQYFTDLPVLLVAVHLLGAAVLTAVMTHVLLLVREGQEPAGGSGREDELAEVGLDTRT
jgi:cytochrome c oxidase assembly protein subunit 15